MNLYDGYAVARRDEAKIVWVQGGPEDYPYVREVAYDLPSRARPPRKRMFGEDQLVAYATLRPTAKASYPGMFQRRCWWVASHDPYPAGPVEAVDPRSIAPGVASQGWAAAGRPGWTQDEERGAPARDDADGRDGVCLSGHRCPDRAPRAACTDTPSARSHERSHSYQESPPVG